jgi:hypothetical protein
MNVEGGIESVNRSKRNKKFIIRIEYGYKVKLSAFSLCCLDSLPFPVFLSGHCSNFIKVRLACYVMHLTSFSNVLFETLIVAQQSKSHLNSVHSFIHTILLDPF